MRCHEHPVVYIQMIRSDTSACIGNSWQQRQPHLRCPMLFPLLRRIMYFVAQGKPIIPTLTYYIGMSFNAVCLWLCWRYPRRKHEPEVSGAAWELIACGHNRTTHA